MRKILISICLSLLAFNAYSQSKLVGAGKGTKVGGSAASKTVSTKTPVKKATPTKPFSQKSSVKQDANERYASSAYMEITGVSFGNVDNDGNIIDKFGAKLYATEVKYLKPLLSYRGLTSSEKNITFYVKIIKEDGTLEKGSESPEGYTYEQEMKVTPGENQSVQLKGWGNNKGGSYSPGLYKYEIWYQNKLIYEVETRLYSGVTPIVQSNIFSISSISFASTDKDRNIISDYGQPLIEGQVQYLKPKIYYYGKYSNNQEVTLYIRYFKSSGELVSGKSSPIGFSFKENVTIKPGSNSVILSGFGNEAATNYKEGDCKVEIWLDGEKLYETNATIRKPGSSMYTYGSKEMNLKAMLEKPMMIGNCNPITASYYSVKNSLSSNYTLEDKSDEDDYTFYLWSSSNSSVRDLTYCGLPFYYFYFSVEKDVSSSLQRVMKYVFEIRKTQVGSLNDAYARLDLIVKDFNNLGIPIRYQRKNDQYTKAKGEIMIGNVKYEIVLEDLSVYQYSINVWVYN